MPQKLISYSQTLMIIVSVGLVIAGGYFLYLYINVPSVSTDNNEYLAYYLKSNDYSFGISESNTLLIEKPSTQEKIIFNYSNFIQDGKTFLNYYTDWISLNSKTKDGLFTYVSPPKNCNILNLQITGSVQFQNSIKNLICLPSI